MKKHFSLILAALMLASSLTAYAAPTSEQIQDAEASGDISALEALVMAEETIGAQASATVTINDTVEKTYNRDLLGVQWEATSRGYAFLDGGTEDLSPAFLNFSDKLFDSTVARWGGASTNDINLMQSIKPLPERSDIYHVDKPTELLSRASNFGVVEFLKANLAINPDMKFIFVVGPWANTPEDVNNFTHFLLDTTGEWAQMRKSYGLIEPINLMAYEVGNENYFTADPDRDIYSPTASREYADKAIGMINAVRADFPDVVFTANVRGRSAVSSNGTAWDDKWIVDIGKMLHSYIDGNISYHSYYEMAATKANMDHIIAKYKEGAGSSAKVKFWITENALFGAANQQSERHNLRCALFNAIFLNEMAERDDVMCANYHNITAENWTLFNVIDGKLYSQSTNDIYRLYETKMGDIYYSTTETSAASGRFSALATKRDDGRMVICMVNMDETTPLHVSFTYKSGEKYKLLHKTTYTGPNIMSAVVSEKTKDIFTTTEASPSQDPFSAITVPAKSIVFAVAEKKTGTYGTYKEPLVEDTYITSVQKSHYYKRLGDTFVAGGIEPENVIYVEKSADADALLGVPSNDPEKIFPYSVYPEILKGNGTVYSLTGGSANLNAINLPGTDFYLCPPYGQSTLNGVSTATVSADGVVTFGGGPSVSVSEYNERRDMLAWAPSAIEEIDGDYTVTVNANKQKYTGFGMRFNMDKNGENYYMLYIGGTRYENTSPKWQLFKVTGSKTATQVLASGSTTKLSGDFTASVKVTGADITVTVTRGSTTETKTYTDTSPFTHAAGEGGKIAFIKGASEDVTISKITVDAANKTCTDTYTASDNNGKALGTATVTTESFGGGDGVTYTGKSSDQVIGSSQFVLMGPSSGNTPVNAPIQANVTNGGPLVISAGINQAALNHNERKCMVTWKPSAFASATDKYRLTVGAYTENSHPGLGIRFHVSADKKSYYMLNIHSPQKDAGKPVWTLYKCVSDTVFPVMYSDAVTSVDTANYMRYDYTADITVLGNTVTVAMNWDGGKKTEYKTFVDQQPFTHKANASGYAGFVKNGQGSVQIKSLKLETYTASSRIENHRFGSGLVLRKIENPNSTPAKVYICNDTNGEYQLLGVVPANGEFVNTLTAKNITNVRVEGGKDLNFYSAVTDTAAYDVGSGTYALSARIGGADAPDAEFSSSKETVIYISGSKLVPLQTGSAAITAKTSAASYTSPAVNCKMTGNFTESFDTYGSVAAKDTSLKTSVRDVTVAGNWVLRQNMRGALSLNPKAMISANSMLLSGPALDPLDNRISYLVYNADIPALNGKYTIKTNINKYNSASGIGIKFHMHDNYDQSYYLLMLNGVNGDSNTWSFYKVVRGAVTHTVKGPSFSSPATSGDGAYSGGDIAVTINVDANNISWSVYGARVGEGKTLSEGKFTDNSFTPISGSVARIGFVASNAFNAGVDSYSQIHDITVTEGVESYCAPTVKTLCDGNIVFLPKYNSNANTRYIRTVLKDGKLENTEVFAADDFSAESPAAFFIPKDEFGITKILVWDTANLRPVCKYITENG